MIRIRGPSKSRLSRSIRVASQLHRRANLQLRTLGLTWQLKQRMRKPSNAGLPFPPRSSGFPSSRLCSELRHFNSQRAQAFQFTASAGISSSGIRVRSELRHSSPQRSQAFESAASVGIRVRRHSSPQRAQAIASAASSLYPFAASSVAASSPGRECRLFDSQHALPNRSKQAQAFLIATSSGLPSRKICKAQLPKLLSRGRSS